MIMCPVNAVTAHKGCDINLKLSEKIPVILHNLRGYDNPLIMQEICKFDVKIVVIPNGLEKYMAFAVNGNLVLIDTMQFINSSLLTLSIYHNNLVVNCYMNMNIYEYMNRFKRFFDDRLPDRYGFYSSLKHECVNHIIYILLMFGICLK